MEFILSALLLLGIFAYYRILDGSAAKHCDSFHVDWGKVSNDRTINNLSNSQINHNIISGKYDKGRILTEAEIKAAQKASWEKYKKDHPWMPLN